MNLVPLATLALVSGSADLLGQGFQMLAPALLTSANEAAPYVFGDFDNDGQLDAMYPAPGGVVRFAGLRLSGNLPETTVGAIGRAVHATADFDNDGALDLLLAPSGTVATSDIQIMFGNGDGTFGAPVVIVPGVTTGFFGVSVQAVDVTGDGRVDVVFTRDLTQSIDVYEQQPSGTFASVLTLTGSIPLRMTLADINGDTLPDIVYSDTPNSLTVRFGGNLTAGQGGAALAGYTILLDAGDLDRDGFGDVVQCQDGSLSTTAALQVHFGSATGLVAGPLMPIAAASGVPVVADLDVDGNRDLVFFTFSSVQSVALLHRGDGAGGFSAGLAMPGLWAVSSFLVDADGDGDPDLFNLVNHQPSYPAYRLQRWENRAIYGAACPGAAGQPELAIGVASPGNTNCAVELSNVPPNSLAVILASLGATAGPCGLQVDISPGSHAVLAGLANPMGELTANWSIPPTGTTGVTLFWQGTALDPTGAFQGFGVRASATVGRAITVF